MKRAYAASQYAKLYEQYCRKHYSSEAEKLFEKAEVYYKRFLKDMPDLGKNMMAKNMLDWFTILAFYEASDHKLDGEVLLQIKREAAEKVKFLGKLVNGNQKWPYKVFEKVYINYNKMQKSTKQRASGWIAGKQKSTPTTARKALAFTSSAALLQSMPKHTDMQSCCRIFAAPTTFWPRYCTQSLSACKRKHLAAAAAIIGTSAMKVPCLKAIKI